MVILKVNSFAQPFGANNATWHFNLYSFFPPFTNSAVEVTSSSPFVFMGDTCYRLSTTYGGCFVDTSFIVKESNDSVYYYLPTSNRFVMLYNYNAMVGDTQTIYGMTFSGGDTSVQLVVTATGTTIINGVTKRTYSTTYASPFGYYYDFAGYTIEDIGNTFFLFPQVGFCDPVVTGIRCYEDTIIGEYNVQPSLSCDTTIWLAVNDMDANRSISISPNPFTSEISIAIQKQYYKQATFTIKGILGQTVFNKQINNIGIASKEIIDLSKLSKGIYILDAIVDGERTVRKIVKQ